MREKNSLLYESLERDFGKKNIKKLEIPSFIQKNLKYKLREYQINALKYFIFFYENEEYKKEFTLSNHLMFNMATGSGKTLLLAALMLYFFSKGKRKFLFFVNSTAIIKKTKSNILDSLSSKYLFQDRIEIDGKNVEIKEVNNFQVYAEHNINICIISTQKLHSGINTERENNINMLDIENTLILADEAHHLNTESKRKQKSINNNESNWEDTVKKVFDEEKQDKNNVLLEFTATLDIYLKSIIIK